MKHLRLPSSLVAAVLGLSLPCFSADASTADAQPKAFSAVSGDRSGGWLPQTRSEVLARNGVVATSQPLAAAAGLQILKQGGNAFDAAVATAAVLNLVEPESAGVGGDVFVLAWSAKEHKLIALNASGRAPTGATPQHLADRGYTKHMPEHGIDSATVPGAVDGWDALLKRAGTMTFKDTLEPAAILAEQGFGVINRRPILRVRRARRKLHFAPAADARIRQPALQQILNRRPIRARPLRLINRPLIPIQPEKFQILNQQPIRPRLYPRPIQILNPQQNSPPIFSCQQPVHQKRPRIPKCSAPVGEGASRVIWTLD